MVVLYWSKFWNWQIFKKLVVAFIPTGIIGLTVYKALKSHLLGNLTVVLWALLVGGIALIVVRALQGALGRRRRLFRDHVHARRC